MVHPFRVPVAFWDPFRFKDLMPQRRRFPLPWTVTQIPGGYVVEDANGMRLAYVYCKDENDRGLTTDYLKPDEALRIAKGIARPPELIGALQPTRALEG